MNDNGDKPAGWRKEWREPKTRRARAHGLAAAIAPLPPPEELRVEAIRNLRAVALDDEASAVARVQAAKALLDVTRPRGDGPDLSEATVDELLAAVQNALALKKGTP